MGTHGGQTMRCQGDAADRGALLAIAASPAPAGYG